MTRPAAVLIAVLLVSAFAVGPLAAQDDRSAGLFTTATQLPLVSQSVVVDIQGGEAVVELTQVFANPGDEIAQADYRLHLPTEAVVTAFGFWHDGRFLAATLKERDQARHDHARAASEGRATAHLQRDGTIHSFSVFPVSAGALQEIQTTIVLPIATEDGRSHVRLPLDRFLGHARLNAGVVARVEAPEALREVGVEGARFAERKRTTHTAELIFSADRPVEIWWASHLEPLLTRAQAVRLEEGFSAIQLRLALNDAGSVGFGPSKIVLLVDTSTSMRRRSREIDELVARVLDRSIAPVRIVAVGETTEKISSRDPKELVRVLDSGATGFTSSWAGMEAAAERMGCRSPSVRCVVITDPQIDSLPAHRDLETVFLADADELSHFAETVGRSSPVHQPGVDSVAGLHALADELVLPVLELESIHQGGRELDPVGAPRRRAAVGGLMRLYVESRSSDELRLGLKVDTNTFERGIEVEEVDPSSALGRSIRRGFYRGRLDDQMADYRRTRDPELKREIVATSLREEIPTALTSLHVASPDRVLSRTATPAPLLRRLGLIVLVIGVVVFVVGRRWLP
jgi:hypothetical protein